MYSVGPLEGQEDKCLITAHNNLEGNVFHDPNPQKSFRFDHLKKAVSEIKDHSLPSPPLRKVLDEKVRVMVARQYGKDASCGVFYKVWAFLFTLTTYQPASINTCFSWTLD